MIFNAYQVAIDDRAQRAERDKRGFILCEELQGLNGKCAVCHDTFPAKEMFNT